MTTLPERTCQVDGCERPHDARGYCEAHYARWKRGGNLSTPIGPPSMPDRKCTIPNCDRKHTARGYCSLHYDRWRTGVSLTAPLRVKIPSGAVCAVETCTRPVVAKGYCDPHHKRWIRGDDPNDPTIYELTLEERFWGRVDKGRPDACWMWTGGTDKNGYGRISQGGKQRRAHRISYQIHHGAIPRGMFVCHSCDTPGCVNPAHLWLGTPADNTADRDQKGRHWGPRGDTHPTAKLTEAHVRAIRRLYRTGKYTQAELGEQFGVTNTTVQLLVNRKTWGHVP